MSRGVSIGPVALCRKHIDGPSGRDLRSRVQHRRTSDAVQIPGGTVPTALNDDDGDVVETSHDQPVVPEAQKKRSSS